MIFELFRWWYGAGWLQAVHNVNDWTTGVRRAFSLPLLVKTLFAPWRRIISISGRGLDAKIQAGVDNLVSRTVGFMSRFIILIAAALLMFLVFVAGSVLVIVWPFIPIAIVAGVIKGITG